MVTKNNKSRRKRPTKSSDESWMNRHWRPAIAWLYFIVVLFDFIIAPVLFGVYSFVFKSQLIQNWVPLTLQGGGLLHLSMGAILGITSWTRGNEKVAMMNNQQYQQYPYGFNTSPTNDLNTQVSTNSLPPIKKPVQRL